MPDMAAQHPDTPDLLATNDLRDGRRRSRSSMGDPRCPSPTRRSTCRRRPKAPRPAQPTAASRCRRCERLHLYLTLSNMRGVPYFVGFEGSGQTRGHHMMCHGDRAHYILEGIGAHRGENKWLPRTTSTASRSRPRRAPARRVMPPMKTGSSTAAALASAAFPLGLAALHQEQRRQVRDAQVAVPGGYGRHYRRTGRLLGQVPQVRLHEHRWRPDRQRHSNTPDERSCATTRTTRPARAA